MSEWTTNHEQLDAMAKSAADIPFADERGATLALIEYLRLKTMRNDAEHQYRDMHSAVSVSHRRDYINEEYYGSSTYEHDVDCMKIHDPVWGECEIKDEPYDQLLLELAQTPVFMRLQAVEQLTFSGEFSTLPNTSRFSRWQHIWGSLAFVRKMTQTDERFSERERIVMQLRTLFSDVGQTSFSHLGDWIFQGIGGGEDLHDQDLRDLLEVSGIEEILLRYGLTLDETVFPEVEDWVECPSPDLCVDRVDYGLRELLRWAAPPIPLNMFLTELHNPKKLFEITQDGRLAITNPKFARYFAAGFSLLPSEDWSHPTHRVVMELMQTAVRDSLLRKVEYSNIHPRELMYGIDNDFDDYFLKWGGAAIGDIMKQIAFEQRRIFTVARKRDLEHVFAGIQDNNWQFPHFPDPIQSYTWATAEFGKYPLPTQLAVKQSQVETPHMRSSKKGLEIGLPRLKARRIDPLVKTKDGYLLLSESEPSYKTYMDEQEQLMARGFSATIYMRKDRARNLVDKYEQTIKEWEVVCRRERDPTFLKKIIAATAFSLMGSGRRFDTFHMSEEYLELIEGQRVRGISDWTDVRLRLDD